jgi:hypothetical protein
MWRPETTFYDWTDVTSTHPKGGVAPLRHDLALARYLEKKRECSLSQDVRASPVTSTIAASATPTEETNHGIAFGVASAVGRKS